MNTQLVEMLALSGDNKEVRFSKLHFCNLNLISLYW